jgi:hypothetical protein
MNKSCSLCTSCLRFYYIIKLRISLLGAAATAVQLCALFDYQSRRRDVSLNIRGAAEDEFFACANVALDSPIDLRYRDRDLSFSNFRTRADN